MNENMTKDTNGLTTRQHLVITEILGSPSIEEACRRAGVSKGTVYKWLADPTFQAELKRQREAVVEQAFNRLKIGMGRAVEKLLALLEEGQESIQLRAAEALLDHGSKAVEQQDLERRLSALEEQLPKRREMGWR